MHVAFVIGTRHYKNLDELECCEADVRAMSFLLRKRSPNTEVIELLDRSSDEIKDAIRKTFSDEPSIVDAIFYLTGHGFSAENDFFFCPSDFDPASPNRTGISRNFILEALRDSKVPQVALIVDTCESGKTLIKREGRPLEDRPPLDRFLQFSSSLDDQYSLTGTPLSKFTKTFVDACFSKASGPIYFTDIEAEIRDAFAGNQKQTPHFIKQGTSREVFAENAEDFFLNRAQFDDMLKGFVVPSSIKDDKATLEQSGLARTQLLKRLEKKFADREMAQKFVDGVREDVLQRLCSNSEVGDYFELSLDCHSDYLQNDIGPVVNAIEKIDRRDRLVSASSFVQYFDSDGKKSRSSLGLLGLGFNGYRETSYSLKLNCQLECVDCNFEFKPLFKALDQMRLRILFVPTLEQCIIFWRISRHPIQDWEKYGDAIGISNWSTRRLEYDDLESAVETISESALKSVDEHVSFVLGKGAQDVAEDEDDD